MQLHGVIYDAAYSAVVADGPVFAVRVQFTRQLDRLGLGRATFPAEPRVLQYLTARRVVELWLYPSSDEIKDGRAARLVGAFIATDITIRHTSSGVVVEASGPSAMLALKNAITLPGLSYDNSTIAAITSDLIGLTSWSVSNEAALSSDNWSGRFQGETVLKALTTVLQSTGYHFRESTTATTVDCGAFGSDSGLTIEYIEGDTAEGLYEDGAPFVLEDISIISASDELYNYIVPFGAGDGDAALTLEDSNRAGISSTSVNGRTHYYISDATSISAYGQVETRLNFKKIGPIGASSTQVQRAANALYDAAKAYLDRYKDPLTTYGVRLRNVYSTIQPGDKIHLRYQGWIRRGDDTRYEYSDIDALVWVMSVGEVVEDTGAHSVELELATVDRYAEGAVDILAGAVDSLNTLDIHQQPQLNFYMYGPYQRILTTSSSATFNFTVRDATVDITSVLLTIRRVGWVEHTHQVMQIQDESVVGPETAAPKIAVMNDGTSNVKFLVFSDGTAGDVFYATGASTLYEGSSSTRPCDIDITVNGSSVATGLLPTLGSADEYELDITAEVLARGGGIHGTHTVLIECNSNYGYIEAELVIEDNILSVRS